MPRYIDADEIQYTMLYKENWITNTGVEKQGVWKDDIDKMPTADVVEVVRCKDCKHYVLYTLFGHTQGWCERLCDEFDKSLAHGTEEDDFCSHGERADT